MLRNNASLGLIALALGSWLALGDIAQATAQKGGGGKGGGGSVGGGGGSKGGGGSVGGARSAPSIRSLPAPSSSPSFGPAFRSTGPSNSANFSNATRSSDFNRSVDPRWNNSRYNNGYYNNGYYHGYDGHHYGYHHHHNDFWRYFAYAAVADWVGFHPYGWWGPYYGYWGQNQYAWFPDVIYDRGVRQAGYAAEQTDGAALIEVLLPTDDARVWLDGNATSSRGTERRYTSPTLQVGHSYSYTVKASWITDDGELRTVERQVPLSAGSRVLVDFNRSQLQRSLGAANKE